jgi:hypothetical protein
MYQIQLPIGESEMPLQKELPTILFAVSRYLGIAFVVWLATVPKRETTSGTPRALPRGK